MDPADYFARGLLKGAALAILLGALMLVLIDHGWLPESDPFEPPARAYVHTGIGDASSLVSELSGLGR